MKRKNYLEAQTSLKNTTAETYFTADEKKFNVDIDERKLST